MTSYWQQVGVHRLLGAIMKSVGNVNGAALGVIQVKLGCSQGTAIEVAKGKRKPDPDEMYDLCRAADIDIGYVIGRINKAGPFVEPSVAKDEAEAAKV